MADKTGYIGRNPGDSSVVIARQSFEVTGSTTDFTFASGYTPGYIDAYLNGSRLIEGSDFTASDSSTVTLLSAATSGDVLELVAYKAFNLVSSTSRIGISSAGENIGTAERLNFIGVGNTFKVQGTTIDVSIAGGAGAGGTWATYTAGIATTKSVGVNTSTLDDNDLVGVGNSFKGIYVSNGMMIVDNELNGDHYIGTAFNGLMAGPVTINGVLTIDGNYVVV